MIPFFCVSCYYYYGEIMLRKVLKLLLIVFWMGLIFVFSMDNNYESSRKSESLILQFSKFVLRDHYTEEKGFEILDKIETPVRKSAHFLLYLFLEIWVLWFLSEFYKLTIKGYIIATLITFIYACSDEFHQLFVSGRSGEVLDVFIDTIGGSVGALFYYLRRKKYEQKKAIG